MSDMKVDGKSTRVGVGVTAVVRSLAGPRVKPPRQGSFFSVQDYSASSTISLIYTESDVRVMWSRGRVVVDT